MRVCMKCRGKAAWTDEPEECMEMDEEKYGIVRDSSYLGDMMRMEGEVIATVAKREVCMEEVRGIGTFPDTKCHF